MKCVGDVHVQHQTWTATATGSVFTDSADVFVTMASSARHALIHLKNETSTDLEAFRYTN